MLHQFSGLVLVVNPSEKGWRENLVIINNIFDEAELITTMLQFTDSREGIAS